jgi:hypothetical protein
MTAEFFGGPRCGDRDKAPATPPAVRVEPMPLTKLPGYYALTAVLLTAGAAARCEYTFTGYEPPLEECPA